MDEEQTFGKRLDKMRLKLGLSKADLAALLNKPVMTVSRWLNNKNKPSNPYEDLKPLEPFCQIKDLIEGPELVSFYAPKGSKVSIEIIVPS